MLIAPAAVIAPAASLAASAGPAAPVVSTERVSLITRVIRALHH